MHWPCAPFSLDTILFNLLAAHSLLHTPYLAYHTLPHIFLHSPPRVLRPTYQTSSPVSHCMVGLIQTPKVCKDGPPYASHGRSSAFPRTAWSLPRPHCSVQWCAAYPRPKTWMPAARTEPSGDSHGTKITRSASLPSFSYGFGVDVEWVSAG